jgi:hypothetical protein
VFYAINDSHATQYRDAGSLSHPPSAQLAATPRGKKLMKG